MLILPVMTARLTPGDDLVTAIGSDLRPGDIVVISSKAVAITEGRLIDLGTVQPSPQAHAWSASTERTPEFCEAVLAEMRRMNGTARGTCPGAILTELKPEGLPSGTILVANAGLDESNAPEGMAIGWPEDPVESVKKLRRSLSSSPANGGGGRGVGVILSDSSCLPRRHGVTAIALSVSGIDPITDLRGTQDLFGKSLRMTSEATADQLATAANAVMGNAADCIPAAIIRDHGLTFSDFEGWVPGIEAEQDLLKGILG